MDPLDNVSSKTAAQQELMTLSGSYTKQCRFCSHLGNFWLSY